MGKKKKRITKGQQRAGEAKIGRAQAADAGTRTTVPTSDPIAILAQDIQANPLGWPPEVIDDNEQLTHYYNNVGDVAPRTFVISVPSANTLGWWADGTDDTVGSEVQSREGRCRETDADTQQKPSVRSAARTALKLVDRVDTELDLTLVSQQQAFTILINEGILQQAEVDELTNATNYTGTRGEELKVVPLGGRVDVGHIVAAKSLIPQTP